MNELMGIIGSLEALINEGHKIPLTGKIVLEEYKVLHMIQKLRAAVQDGESMIRKSIEVGGIKAEALEEGGEGASKINAYPVIEQAMHKAQKIESGANEYADYVLANLQLVVSKLAQEISKMDRNIEKGREVLAQKEDQNEK